MTAKKLSCALVLLLCCALAAPAMAQRAVPGRQCPPHGPGPKMFFKLLRGLDLTGEQQEQLDELKKQTMDQIQPLVEQIEALEVPRILLAEEIDIDNATQVLAAAQDLGCQIGAIRGDATLQAAQILTPEQRQELLEQLTRLKQRRQKRGEGRPPRLE